ncbi:ATP-dependent metallopeptidase FtsH/Yme1/Tma family protein [Clostridium hydrogenum]|uniref:ATP-dependent metallopeptidase FtsH/Yme1/Tma family protein n=1 Tax=Clostridium hydrogenum TaxID=2855764 RepID=UPI001F20FEFF|nr:ATP-dependent metallopeptidase FtsH/Yme1/Tma family protein [Clostridium hydrogenum]
MKNLKNKHIFIPIIVSVFSIILMIVSNYYSKSNNYVLYTNFEKDILQKKISTVYLTNSESINVKLKNGSIYTTDNPRTNDFKENLLKNGIKVSEQAPVYLGDVIPAAFLSLSVLYIVFISLKSSKLSSKKMFAVDALDTDVVKDIGINFENVAGNEEAKESVKDVIDFLKNPEKYHSYGARMPKGIILYGEPGTGKTLLAKAVAGEANVPFYAMSGSDFVQVYVGVGASRIRQLFKKARNHGRAVIFIDEIDAIGKKRNGKAGGSEERDQTLNALLTEMSGFNEKQGIVVIAATNRLDVLDSALLRPGRFDRHIEVNLPDIAARKKILSLHLQNKPIKDIDIDDLSRKTSYFSGAKLENLVNEAAILACKDNSNYIENIHFQKAFSIVVAGHEKINRDHISSKDRNITAYHEAGHAIVSMKMLPEDKISKVTIIPSTKGAGGYTLSIPEDKMYQNKDYITKRIMVTLGGRAAEEIIFGKNHITTGAYSDLKQSTKMITSMLTQYGMGTSLGLLNIEELSSIDPSASNLILEECKDKLNEIYESTKKLLIENKHLLETMSNRLLQDETIYDKDIDEMIC